MALLVLLLNVMAEGAIWAFLERIAVSGGFTTEFAANVMAFSFFASGAGSVFAAAIGARFGSTGPFIVAVSLSIASVWVLWVAGAALGPALAGLLVIDGSFLYVYLMCMAAWVATIVLFLAAQQRLRDSRS